MLTGKRPDAIRATVVVPPKIRVLFAQRIRQIGSQRFRADDRTPSRVDYATMPIPVRGTIFRDRGIVLANCGEERLSPQPNHSLNAPDGKVGPATRHPFPS